MRDHGDVKRIVEPCDELHDGDPDQRDVKKYLTRFLLIKTCGAYENEIGGIVYGRTRRSCDKEAASLISSSMLAYKHLSLDSLKGNIVGKFGKEHKKEFAKRIEGSSGVRVQQHRKRQERGCARPRHHHDL